MGPRNCRQPGAVLATTSGSRIRSCKHLPFAQSASEANALCGIIKTGEVIRISRLENFLLSLYALTINVTRILISC